MFCVYTVLFRACTVFSAAAANCGSFCSGVISPAACATSKSCMRLRQFDSLDCKPVLLYCVLHGTLIVWRYIIYILCKCLTTTVWIDSVIDAAVWCSEPTTDTSVSIYTCCLANGRCRCTVIKCCQAEDSLMTYYMLSVSSRSLRNIACTQEIIHAFLCGDRAIQSKFRETEALLWEIFRENVFFNSTVNRANCASWVEPFALELCTVGNFGAD